MYIPYASVSKLCNVVTNMLSEERELSHTHTRRSLQKVKLVKEQWDQQTGLCQRTDGSSCCRQCNSTSAHFRQMSQMSPFWMRSPSHEFLFCIRVVAAELHTLTQPTDKSHPVPTPPINSSDRCWKNLSIKTTNMSSKAHGGRSEWAVWKTWEVSSAQVHRSHPSHLLLLLLLITTQCTTDVNKISANQRHGITLGHCRKGTFHLCDQQVVF